MIFKTNFQGFAIRPIDMYDLLQKKYPTVNKITNACLKRIIKYLANLVLTINVHNSFITQLV